MSDKQRDPKTGRFVKSGMGVPVRDADDQVIDNLKERLVASASRVSYLEKVVKDQSLLIDQLQVDAASSLLDVTDNASTCLTDNQELVVPESKRGYRLIAWGLVLGGCLLFWYGVAQFFFGGK